MTKLITPVNPDLQYFPIVKQDGEVIVNVRGSDFVIQKDDLCFDLKEFDR